MRPSRSTTRQADDPDYTVEAADPAGPLRRAPDPGRPAARPSPRPADTGCPGFCRPIAETLPTVLRPGPGRTSLLDDRRPGLGAAMSVMTTTRRRSTRVRCECATNGAQSSHRRGQPRGVGDRTSQGGSQVTHRNQRRVQRARRGLDLGSAGRQFMAGGGAPIWLIWSSLIVPDWLVARCACAWPARCCHASNAGGLGLSSLGRPGSASCRLQAGLSRGPLPLPVAPAVGI